jgi:hypothetical protein
MKISFDFDETDEDGELNEEELREAVKSGQITGFIGVMKNFE